MKKKFVSQINANSFFRYSITGAFQQAMDITKQRIPLTLALFSILTSFVYIYLYELILVVIVFVSVWKGYDYIQDLTKEALDPTGKYIFITGCDSG